MKLIETKIDGLVLLEPTIIRDNRGYFTESFNQNVINNLFGELNLFKITNRCHQKGF